jgi:hypothetical protein
MSQAQDTSKTKSLVSNREDRSKLIATSEIPDRAFLNLKDSQSPISYLGAWDFYIVTFAIVLRFMIDTEKKSQEVKKEKGEEFQMKKYLDGKHLRRWLIHIFTAFVGLFVLPQIFIVFIYKKYNVGLSDWTLIGSAVVGFLGFDLIRISEKVCLAILSKLIGYKTDEK